MHAKLKTVQRQHNVFNVLPHQLDLLYAAFCFVVFVFFYFRIWDEDILQCVFLKIKIKK